MRSPTILVLFAALLGLASGAKYFQKEHIEKAQTQVNLVLFAHKEHNIGLLYKLIPFGYDIDRYLADHPNQLQVHVGQAAEFLNGQMRAIVFIQETGKANPKFYRAELTMNKDSNSPTGYVISKGYICHNACELGDKPVGFF